MNLLEFALSYLAGFATLVVIKSISEPIAAGVGKLILSRSRRQVEKILPQVWDSLDLEWISQAHIQKGISTYQWLIETCIPEKAKGEGIELNDAVIEAVANHVLSNFDLDKHLAKRG
jgi:hypothetical protein